MCLILEQQHPILILTINIRLKINCACVNLFRLHDIHQLAVLLECLDRDGCNIHKADWLVHAQLLAQLLILTEGLVDSLVLKYNASDSRVEGRVTAVV